MQSFEYTIKDELGIHARPAGMLAKKVKEYTSKITLTKGEKEVEIARLMALMGLGVKNGETVTIKADGADEEAAIVGMKKIFEENL